MSLALTEAEEPWQPWLREAQEDTICARLLFNAHHYARSLFHLQQANEKLAKGMLIRLGFLRPHRSKENNAIELVLGFGQKEPKDYSHRTLKSFLGDIESGLEGIEKIWMRSRSYMPKERRMKYSELLSTIKKSKRGVRELKRKPLGIVTSYESLQNELGSLKTLLDQVKEVRSKRGEQIPLPDPTQVRGMIASLARPLGKPEYEKVILNAISDKEGMLAQILLGIVFLVCLELSMFLDPLEQVTRYPEEGTPSFDEESAYVRCFSDFEAVITECLEQAGKKG